MGEQIGEALKGYNCDEVMVEQIVLEADKNHDGEIDYQEFVEMMRDRDDLKNAAGGLKGMFVDMEALQDPT